jgi:hypothetical protein
MNPTQIFKFARIRIYSENRKLIRLPLGRIRARPSCTVVHGPRLQCRLSPCAQHMWPMACRAGLGLRGPRLCGTARERTPERSLLSGHASRRSRRWRYCGGGGAKEGAQAPTTERPPVGHVGGGDSSPEFLADGEGGGGKPNRWRHSSMR